LKVESRANLPGFPLLILPKHLTSSIYMGSAVMAQYSNTGIKAKPNTTSMIRGIRDA